MNILLVRPSFPDSRNSIFRIPIGLCKISSWRKSLGDTVYYIEGFISSEDIPYDIINKVYITSMFTYWSSYVITTINYYKKRCQNAEIIVGGIYASISPDHVKDNSDVDTVVVGVIPEAENLYPDYSILSTDNADINNTQIIWTSRGCERRCSWCFTHVIEPSVYFKDIFDVKNELLTNKDRKNIILYDNSFLQNPILPTYLNLFVDLHKQYKFKFSACQGIDGRMMKEWTEKGVHVAELMEKAGFYDLRFSYDHEGEKESLLYCINEFEKAGYKRNEMQIFVIINNFDSPEKIESRYWFLYELGVQIHSDRMRPADWYYDNYYKGGTDYFINEKYGWTNINIRGMLRFMSALNYANRMNIMYVEGNFIQHTKDLNVGKSSRKLDEWNGGYIV